MYAKNAAAPFLVVFRKTSDGSAETTGTPAAVRSIASTSTGSFGSSASGTGTFTHRGNGQWEYLASNADMDGARVGFLFTLTGCHPVEIEIFTYEVFRETFVSAATSYDPTYSDLDGDSTPTLMQLWSSAGAGVLGKTVDAVDGTSFDQFAPDNSTSIRTIAVDTTGAAAERARIADLINDGIDGTVAASPSPTSTTFKVQGLPTTSAGLSNGFLTFRSGALEGVAERITSFAVIDGTSGTVTLAAALPSAPASGVSVRIVGRK